MQREVEILLVEDTMTQRLLLEGLLRSLGCSVVPFATGTKALEYLKTGDEQSDRTKQKVILTDINMPGMTGYELCRAVRSDAEHELTPVILMESLKEFSSLNEIVACNADAFIYKELEEAYFVPAIRRILSSAKEKQAALPQVPVNIGGMAFEVASNLLTNLLTESFEICVYLANKTND